MEGGANSKSKVAISFPIPLAEPISEENVHIHGEGNFTDFCESGPGVAKANTPGTLCIYPNVTEEASELLVTDITLSEEKGASRSGAFIQYKLGPAGYAGGNFAVSGN